MREQQIGAACVPQSPGVALTPKTQCLNLKSESCRMLTRSPLPYSTYTVLDCALVVLISAEMRDVACGVAGLSMLEQRYNVAHPRFIVYYF